MNGAARIFSVLLAMTAAAFAQPIPDIQLVPVASGFRAPVHATGSRDGSGRLFVVEQAGRIRVVDRTAPIRHGVFLSITDHVTAGGEMGLLSVAFHPDFRNNRKLFVNYTTSLDKKLYTQVSQFIAKSDRSSVNTLTERSVLRFEQPFPNHNGGQLAFGPDGYLYIGNGDGGSANDPFNNGQRLDTVLGKILRIDVSHVTLRSRYTIPPDNPFVGRIGTRPEIFAYGLRNPWRFSFDRETGTIVCGDVGQNAREEIDVIRKGANYGWRIMEGTICTPGVNASCSSAGLQPPVLDYPRDQGMSVTGGFVYRGTAHPGLRGVYVYGDYVTGMIWGLRLANNQVAEQRVLLDTDLSISSFGEDDNNELYVVAHSGTIYQVMPP